MFFSQLQEKQSCLISGLLTSNQAANLAPNLLELLVRRSIWLPRVMNLQIIVVTVSSAHSEEEIGEGSSIRCLFIRHCVVGNACERRPLGKRDEGREVDSR